MKKFCVLFCVLLLCAFFCACGSLVSIMPGTEIEYAGSEANIPSETDTGAEEDVFEETPLFAFMGWDDFGDNFYTDTPVALSLQYNTADGEGCVSPVFDRATVIAACEALRSMTVTGTAPDNVTQERVYTFTMSDGEELSVTFDDFNLSLYTGNYTVSGGDALWDILFPAYSTEYDVFDLYFSDNVRAFADNFYTDTPVSLGIRSNGGATLTSSDPEIIGQVFEILSGASVNLVENSADQNIDVTQTHDFIFTMADGSVYTFTFAQQCLAVEVNNTYGAVHYWLGNTSDLWNISIVPEETETVFEGGTLSDMRDDILRAAQVAAGEQEGLSVIGVYVGYTIDGEEGYLTLQDSDASDFVRQVASIQTSGEQVTTPGGEGISVSVTLSDWSGPIIYFTGDSVQKVVGADYACDSDDMAALRNTILSLASQGNNDVEVTE